MSLALVIITYTAVVCTGVYLLVYSRIYDWWKSSLGKVMNFSLLSITVVAIGAILDISDVWLGSWLIMLGWTTYIVLLLSRLIILLSFARKRKNINIDKPMV